MPVPEQAGLWRNETDKQQDAAGYDQEE